MTIGDAHSAARRMSAAALAPPFPFPLSSSPSRLDLIGHHFILRADFPNSDDGPRHSTIDQRVTIRLGLDAKPRRVGEELEIPRFHYLAVDLLDAVLGRSRAPDHIALGPVVCVCSSRRRVTALLP